MTVDSKEREYAIRVCWLIMTVGRDVVRQHLDALFSPGTGPGSLDKKLKKASSQNTIHNLPKVFNSLDVSKIYPSSGTTGSSKDFDVSLLIKLLRNIGGLSAPVGGWDNLPHPSNIGISDDIARIKYYRNKTAHNEDFMLSEEQFDEFWHDLSNALLRIGGNAYEPIVNGILTNPLSEAAMDAKKELHLWYLKDLDVNSKFGVQLEKLKDMLKELEENRHNDKMMEEVRCWYKLLQDEHSKQVGEMSEEQREIHLQNIAAIEDFGIRLHELEKSVKKHNSFHDHIISLWQLITLTVITGIVVVCFSQNSKHLVSFSLLIAVGGIIFYNLNHRKSTEPVLTAVPVRSTPDLIGRDNDIEKIKEMLKDQSLVVIRAPFGFGTSEVSVAVARQWNAKVVHIDMRDIGYLVSTEIITLLGLHPLPDTKSQLRSLYSRLSGTLFLFDNLDFVTDKKEIVKADFEMTIRFLTDSNICKDIKVLCATQHTMSILSDIGTEYLLPPLNNKESQSLLIRLNPSLSPEDAKGLAKASMGIPLAIRLIFDLLREGHIPQDILNGIEDDIGNLDSVSGLEERKKLITISLQYIRSLDQSIQIGFKSLAFIFDGSFSSSAAKAILQGSDFDKQMILIKLNSTSLMSFDNYKRRYYVHQFFQRLMIEKNSLNKAIKAVIIKRHRNYFMDLIHRGAAMWFSRNSKEAITLIRLEASNIMHMFELVVQNGIDIEDLDTICSFIDIRAVQYLLEFIRCDKVAGFIQTLKNAVTSLDESSENNKLSVYLVHSYLEDDSIHHQHLDDFFQSMFTSIKIDNLPLDCKLQFFVDKSRFLNENDELIRSVATLNMGLAMIPETYFDNDEHIVYVGKLLAEVSFLLYTYYNRVNEKRKMFSSDKDIIWVEGIRKSKEVTTLATYILSIEVTVNNPLILNIVKCTGFCQQNSLDKCLKDLVVYSTKAQAMSLALYLKVLGQNHKLSAFSFDRLAFLLNIIENYEKSVEFRNTAINIRKLYFNGDHPDLAWSYYGLGTTLEKLSRISEALEAYQHSLNIRQKILPKHYLTAKSYYKVGQLSKMLGFTNDAIKALSKSIEIRKMINDEPESIARALCEYGDLLASTNDEELKKEALKIYEEERKYQWRKTYSEAKKRLELQEDERSGQGKQGWGHSFVQLDKTDDGDKEIEWIRMQVSNSGEVLGHGIIPRDFDSIQSSGFIPDESEQKQNLWA